MVAEVIASAFASGFSWGGDAAGKRVYCASTDLKGGQIMSAFEEIPDRQSQVGERTLWRSDGGDAQQGVPMRRGMMKLAHDMTGSRSLHR